MSKYYDSLVAILNAENIQHDHTAFSGVEFEKDAEGKQVWPTDESGKTRINNKKGELRLASTKSVDFVHKFVVAFDGFNAAELEKDFGIKVRAEHAEGKHIDDGIYLKFDFTEIEAQSPLRTLITQSNFNTTITNLVRALKPVLDQNLQTEHSALAPKYERQRNGELKNHPRVNSTTTSEVTR